MLEIVGAPKVRATYTNLPMHDGAGKVTAYLHRDHVTYRPIGGPMSARKARADIIAASTSGLVQSVVKKSGTVSLTVTVYF